MPEVTCSNPNCEEISPGGQIYCEGCQPWVDKFGILRGETQASAVQGLG